MTKDEFVERLNALMKEATEQFDYDAILLVANWADEVIWEWVAKVDFEDDE